MRTNTNLPPVRQQPAPGTQTSDKYGNVISTRPLPPEQQPPAVPLAPTSDKWGNIVSVPPGYTEPARPLPPGAVGTESNDGSSVEWK